MKRIHFVYAHGSLKSCPNAISSELTDRFIRDGFTVFHYAWEEFGKISPRKGDVLLGHPNGLPFTHFRNSLNSDNWARKIIIYPFSHGLLGHSSFIDFMIADCDQFLAITGHYWFNTIGSSSYAHWLPKMTHLDLAVNRENFPFIKKSFNPPGSRKFAYIGGQQRYKNIDYLISISRHSKNTFSWFGLGKRPMPGFQCFGYTDFQSDDGKTKIADHDFLITVGNSDANPTTILEAMSWGLVPICSHKSGYLEENESGIINIPLDDIPGILNIIEKLQNMDEERLKTMQVHNIKRLEDHFNWDRFYLQVRQAVLSESSPLLEQQSLKNKLLVRSNALFLSERSSFLRPSVLKQFSLKFLQLIQSHAVRLK